MTPEPDLHSPSSLVAEVPKADVQSARSMLLIEQAHFSGREVVNDSNQPRATRSSRVGDDRLGFPQATHRRDSADALSPHRRPCLSENLVFGIGIVDDKRSGLVSKLEAEDR
jgi:hypothetical protein